MCIKKWAIYGLSGEAAEFVRYMLNVKGQLGRLRSFRFDIFRVVVHAFVYTAY